MVMFLRLLVGCRFVLLVIMVVGLSLRMILVLRVILMLLVV